MSVRVTHIFRPFPMFFVSFCLSYIRFLLPVELPLNISCSTGSLTSNSPQLLFLWKNLPFSLFFEKYFHWTQNSELIFFFFQFFEEVTELSPACFISDSESVLASYLCASRKCFFPPVTMKTFPLSLGFSSLTMRSLGGVFLGTCTARTLNFFNLWLLVFQ